MEVESCVFVKLPFHLYAQYAYCKQRNSEQMVKMLAKILPFYSEITKTKKFNILGSFEELHFYGGSDGLKPGTVLEKEGSQTGYIYIVLRGHVHLFKKIRGLYPSCNSKPLQIDHKTLPNFHLPKDSNTEDVGVHVASIGGPETILGENTGLLKLNNDFSMVSGVGLVVLRYTVTTALQTWPLETQRQLRSSVFSKYFWIYK